MVVIMKIQNLQQKNITATPNTAGTQVTFKNCIPFKDCRTEINDTFVDSNTKILDES